MPMQAVDAGSPTRGRPFGLESVTGTVLASFAFACLLSIAVFPDVWASMVRVWMHSETFAHGFTALPCAAWMLWRRRSDWQALPQRPWWPATFALFACGLIWLVGRLGGVSSLEQFGTVGIIPATMLLLVGPAITRAIAFPLAFLFFAVPVGEFLTPIMMDYTADATVAAVRWSGVPVFREGLHFSLPSGRWSVVEACSGLRYLIASLALGVLYAYLQFRTLRYRLAFVALAIVVPIVANWVRAYGIVMLGHISNMKLAAGVDHLIYGWLFFGLVMALLFWAGSLWREPVAASTSIPATRGAIPMDEPDRLSRSSSNNRRIALVLAAVAIVALWRPLSNELLDQSESFDGVGPLRAAIDGLPPAQSLDYEPHYTGASGTLRIARTIDGTPVELHAYHYARQHETSEMIHGSNYVVRADDFQSQILSKSTRSAAWGSVASYRIRRAGTGLLLVWQWYAIGDTQTANPYRAKAATAWSLLTGRGDESLALVLVTPIETGGGATSAEHLRAAARRLRLLADALQPAIRSVVQAPAPR
ncbi:MAG: exosortase A [Burkholderiaceae bacterium]|nr:exosortase A [Burkholderiaceae bacterium]